MQQTVAFVLLRFAPRLKYFGQPGIIYSQSIPPEAGDTVRWREKKGLFSAAAGLVPPGLGIIFNSSLTAFLVGISHHDPDCFYTHEWWFMAVWNCSCVSISFSFCLFFQNKSICDLQVFALNGVKRLCSLIVNVGWSGRKLLLRFSVWLFFLSHVQT